MYTTFLLAGFDTAASTLAVTCHYLATHPAVRERLCEQIDGVCGGEMVGRERPSYEQLAQLDYLEACLKEALRMVPVAALGSCRLCTETTRIGSLTIEAGTYVQADVYACHYDAALWGGDVDEYRPERMLDGKRRHLLSWFPFGAGPRMCVAARLADLEMKSMLAQLLLGYRLEACAGTEVLELTGAIVLSPRRVMVRLVRRKGTVGN